MFWEIKMHDYKDSLNCVNQFMVSLFRFMAMHDTFDCEQFKQIFPVSEHWVLKTLDDNSDQGKAFQKNINDLFALPEEERKRLYQAVIHDLEFISLPRSTFQFQIKKLENSKRKIMYGIFYYFYSRYFDSDKGILLEPLSPQTITKMDIRDKFFLANEFVQSSCPICLSQVTNGDGLQIEHYFPKSVYPTLIFHPFNLHYACYSCNTLHKKTKSPLANSVSSLDKIFIPYLEPVITYADIEVIRGETADVVTLKAKDKRLETQEKIDNFDRLFNLQPRWSADLKTYYAQWRYLYRETSLTKEELKIKLCERVADLKKIMERSPQKYVEGKYMEWVYSHQFDAFYDGLFDKSEFSKS